MNIEIAKQWAAELRSGKYQQTTGALCDEGGHCCLGVLCRIAVAAGVIPEPEPCGREFAFDGSVQFLPQKVREWSGVQTDEGIYGAEEGGDDPPRLTGDNDEGITFPEIADIIEQHAEEL